MAFWLDSGDGTTSVTRSGDDDASRGMDLDEEEGTARAPPTTGITLRNRNVRTALGITSAPVSLVNVAASVSADHTVVRQNGRNVFAFSTDSTGLVGTFGPLASVWTVSLFVYMEGPCDAYGVYPGLGAQRLLECTAVGLAVDVPRGGTVPSEPADRPEGSAAGTAWDVPFVQQWRQLTVVNDAVSRRTYVDGVLQATAAASTFTVAANTGFTLCKGCQAWLAECLVWNAIALSVADMQAVLAAQRIKWAAAVRTSAAAIASSQLVGASLEGTVSQQPLAAAATLPVGVPTPDGCWLDASAGWTLWSDSTATTAAVPNGVVRAWRDRSGQGRHLDIAAASGATWAWGRTHRSPSDLPLVRLASGPGTFTGAGGPLANAFTVVAVWRLNAKTGVVGGHPCSVGATARFSSTLWKETLGVDEGRIMPLPTDQAADLKYVHGDMVVALWERNAAGALTWRVRALVATNAGAVQWTSSSAASQTAWLSRSVQVNATGCALSLAELMVWRSALSAGTHALLQDYLRIKWGLKIGTAATITKSIPIDVNAPLTELVYDTSVAGSLRLGTDTSLPASQDGETVLEIWPAEEGRSVYRMRVRTGGSPLPQLKVASDGKIGVRTRSTPEPLSTFPFLQLPSISIFTNNNGVNNKTFALVFFTPYALNNTDVGTSPGIAPWKELISFSGQKRLMFFREYGQNNLMVDLDTQQKRMPTVPAYSTQRHAFCFSLFNHETLRYCSSLETTITVRDLVIGDAYWQSFSVNSITNMRVLNDYPGEVCEFRIYPRTYTQAELKTMCEELKAKWAFP